MKSPQAVIYLPSSSLIYFLFYGLVITCLTSATVSASYGGNETDYHALLSFKSTITHDPDKVLTSWNDSFHFCDWSGNLSFLRTLSIRNNSFQGAIPHELGRLFRLPKKLGVPPPPALATFEMTEEDKKRKREELIKHVFVMGDLIVDGTQRNVAPPAGVIGKEGLYFRENHSSILPAQFNLSDFKNTSFETPRGRGNVQIDRAGN
ncbi:leucine-rich repeat protein [Tanacetum coccineum]